MRRRLAIAGTVLALAAVLVAVELLSGTDNPEPTPAPALPSAVLRPPRVDLADLRGRPAAINFWASWCGPCREEADQIERAARAERGRAAVVGVDYSDSRAAATAFIRSHHLTYPVLADPDGLAGDRYGVSALPETAILDRAGRLVRMLRGPQTASSIRRALGAA